ncbi:MAG: 3-deoxy-7-phosphoheptulonate synthase, partial [Pseudomonadota bacterium]|nr:3-deoxy-7-phosphoheptulonate synthase [Pseudomonadota bacterium]
SAACAASAAAKLPCRLMVDASHGNSQKKHDNQAIVLRDIADQLERGERRIFGVMIESHLVAGNQSMTPGKPLAYGQSITDACLGWDATVPLLERLAEAVRTRRASS